MLYQSTRQRQSALAATIKQMETERNRMSQERVSKLLTFLETVNDHASRLFQELCPYGDCSLVYSGDNALLFEEGVSLRFVRETYRVRESYREPCTNTFTASHLLSGANLTEQAGSHSPS